MKKFLIERIIPGAGKMTNEELKAIAKKSVTVISVLGKPYNWLESYVTNDRIICIHEAEKEEDIVEHAECGGFPISRIQEIVTVIDPSTAL